MGVWVFVLLVNEVEKVTSNTKYCNRKIFIKAYYLKRISLLMYYLIHTGVQCKIN